MHIPSSFYIKARASSSRTRLLPFRCSRVADDSWSGPRPDFLPRCFGDANTSEGPNAKRCLPAGMVDCLVRVPAKDPDRDRRRAPNPAPRPTPAPPPPPKDPPAVPMNDRTNALWSLRLTGDEVTVPESLWGLSTCCTPPPSSRRECSASADSTWVSELRLSKLTSDSSSGTVAWMARSNTCSAYGATTRSGTAPRAAPKLYGNNVGDGARARVRECRCVERGRECDTFQQPSPHLRTHRSRPSPHPRWFPSWVAHAALHSPKTCAP